MRVATAVACPFVVALAMLCATPAAGNPPTATELEAAKQHNTAGMRYYDLTEYEPALREFKEAYRLVGDPAFLFDIAQCHRKLGQNQEALTFYKTYRRRAPQASNRAEADRFIAELERTETSAASKPAAPPTGAAAAASPPSAPASIPAPVPPAPPPAAPTLVASPGPVAAETAHPLYTRTWFWIGAAVVVAGAATAAILATRGSSGPGPFCPDCATTTPVDPR
jgi:hypothetical protein